jgi:hypothetical protein
VIVTAELVLPLIVAVTVATVRVLLDRLTLQMPVVGSVVQVVESSVPKSVAKVTGALVVGVGVGLPSVAVTVSEVLDVPGRSTVVAPALRTTFTGLGFVPLTQGLKCGSAAVMVWLAVLTVDGTAIARPLGSM